MEVLELIPLKRSKLKLILIESEFPIDWWFEVPAEKKNELNWNLHLISKEYLNLIEKIIKKFPPIFAGEEKGSRWEEVQSQDDPLSVLFKNYNIPYQMIDISENAEGYLYANLHEHRSLIKQLKTVINNYSNLRGEVLKNEFDFQRALLWGQYLKQEYNERENEVRFKVREAWMMMKIMDKAREIKSKNLTALFICDVRHFDGIKQYAEELGVEIEEIKIKRKPQIATNIENSTLKNILDKTINLIPIKIRKKEKLEKICYFFDTDENASPFDINMAYDAGFDIVVPISKISADQVPKLVQDAIFSRKPSAPTSFFVGGSNVEEGNKIAKKVINSLVPPFECPVIIDPRGSHTTASAIVAKTLEVTRKHGITNLANKKVVCLGGTGPVGQICALIASSLGANVIITSRRKQYVKELTQLLNKKADKGTNNIKGELAATEEHYYKIVKDADIIWSVGKAGVQMLSKDIMKRLKPNKIVVDINIVPPYGIEGIKSEFNDIEFYPGIYGIGALDIGRLKYKIEHKIFNEATLTKGKKIFEYNIAFELASKMILGEEIKISN